MLILYRIVKRSVAESVSDRASVHTRNAAFETVSAPEQYRSAVESGTTLYNVCSAHRGMFSTSGDTMSTSGGYHEYIGGCSVHRRDTMSTLGGVQYIGGIP